MSGTDSVQTAIKKEVELIIMAGSVLIVSVLTVLFSAFFSYNKTSIRMRSHPQLGGMVVFSSPRKSRTRSNGGYAMYNYIKAIKILKENCA